MLSGKLTDGSIAFSSLPPAFSLGNFTYIFLIVSRGKRGDARRAAVLTKAERLLELKQKQLQDGKVDGARLSSPPADPADEP